MLDAIKPLLDSNLITEETRQEINEAWEAKLSEAREQARAELREEFAQRLECLRLLSFLSSFQLETF